MRCRTLNPALEWMVSTSQAVAPAGTDLGAVAAEAVVMVAVMANLLSTPQNMGPGRTFDKWMIMMDYI
jgi:hypothetical protein